MGSGRQQEVAGAGEGGAGGDVAAPWRLRGGVHAGLVFLLEAGEAGEEGARCEVVGESGDGVAGGGEVSGRVRVVVGEGFGDGGLVQRRHCDRLARSWVGRLCLFGRDGYRVERCG